MAVGLEVCEWQESNLHSFRGGLQFTTAVLMAAAGCGSEFGAAGSDVG
jgi:hypothetical protein